MSENFGRGIPLASGFDLGAKSPLDSRIYVDTLEERDLHVTENRAYEGMLVYVKEDNYTYRWNGNEWEMIATKEYVDKAILDVTINTDEIELENYVSKNEFSESHEPISFAEIDNMIGELFDK